VPEPVDLLQVADDALKFLQRQKIALVNLTFSIN
jgi:hypothetical protein